MSRRRGDEYYKPIAEAAPKVDEPAARGRLARAVESRLKKGVKARKVRPRKGTKGKALTKKVRKERIETISRVYSERAETRAISPMVAYVPYETERPISGESTAIYSMSYNFDKRILTITFWGYKMRKKGSTYIYFGVPEDVWVALTRASSKGRFFYYNIRTRYSYSRVG